MRVTWLVLTGVAVLFVVGLALLLSLMPAETPDGPPAAPARGDRAAAALHIGLMARRDPIVRHRRYRRLAAYLTARLDRPVELTTELDAELLLEDLATARIHVAVLDPLAATVLAERLGVELLLRPETPAGASHDPGAIFVRADSSVHAIEDLGGRPLALVDSTAAGELYPLCATLAPGALAGGGPPVISWATTDGEAIERVVAGHVEAGAVRASQLDSYERAHPGVRLRRIAVSEPLPTETWIRRSEDPPPGSDDLVRALLAMTADPEGRSTLREFGAGRFVACRPEEYAGVRTMLTVVRRQRDAVGLPASPSWPLAAAGER